MSSSCLIGVDMGALQAPIIRIHALMRKGRIVAEQPKLYHFTGNETSPLEALNRLKSERGLTDAEIDRCGIRIVSSIDSKAELGHQEPHPLIKIPYWGITNERLLDNRGNQLSRFRRTVVNEKRERYTQRSGTGARHYLPPGIDWLTVAKDVTVPIFYTEGEFKAIRSSKGLGPTIGNAGVTSWRGPLGQGLASPFDEFDFKGREIYLVYDAEASSTAAVPLKNNIVRAQGELALDLIMRGAVVKQLLIARTPVFVEGKKMGVDDYFLAGGTRDALMSTACDPMVDAAWQRFHITYAVFRGTKAHVLNIGTGAVHTRKELMDLVEASEVREVGKRQMKAIDMYLQHEDCNWFDQYVYDPQLPPGFLNEEHKFNTWQGFEIEANKGPNYSGHIELYSQFVKGVWGANADFFLDWTSHLFQRPWETTTISLILVSRVKGVGKSLTGQFLRTLIGRRGSFTGSVEGLTEKFTGELEGKLFVQVDEADALFARKESALKALDGDMIRIRKMQTEGYTVPNYLRKFYTTNEDAAFRMAADERRYFVHRVSKLAVDGLETSEWSKFLRAEVAPLLKNVEFLENLMEFFMTRELGAWDANAPVPRTEAMLDMAEAGMTKKDSAAESILEALYATGKPWVTSAQMERIDRKLWGTIRSTFKDNGGRTLQAQAKIDGKVLSFTFWAPDPKTVDILEDSIHGAHLRSGQYGGAQLGTLLLATKNLTDPMAQHMEGSKY